MDQSGGSEGEAPPGCVFVSARVNVAERDKQASAAGWRQRAGGAPGRKMHWSPNAEAPWVRGQVIDTLGAEGSHPSKVMDPPEDEAKDSRGARVGLGGAG